MARNDPRSVRLSDDQERRFEAFTADTGDSDNQALKRLVDRGLDDLGYSHNGTHAGHLRHGMQEAAKAVTYASISVFAITALTDVDLAVIASICLIAAMGIHQASTTRIPKIIAQYLYTDTNTTGADRVSADGD